MKDLADTIKSQFQDKPPVISLGDSVRDVVTDYEGYVVGVAKHLNGSSMALVAPVISMEGLMREEYWIDALRLEKIDERSGARPLPRGTISFEAPPGIPVVKP